MLKFPSSVKFKRDYISALAVLLFILTVTTELFLAIYIPVQMKDSPLWNTEASLQELEGRVDHVMDRFKNLKVKSKNPAAGSEVKLAGECIREFNSYIKKYRSQLTLNEIHQLNNYITRFDLVLKSFENNLYYGKENNIAVKKVLDNFIREKKQQLSNNY